MNIPRFLQLYKEGRLEDAFLVGHHRQPAARLHRPRLPASLRQPLPPRRAWTRPSTCATCTGSSPTPSSCPTSFDAMVERVVARKLRAHRPQGRGRRRRAHRPHLRLLPRAARPRRSPSTNRGRRPAACCATRCPSTACRKAVLDKEIELIERLGVKFQFNTHGRRRTSRSTTSTHQYDAVFLAIGTWKEAWVYLPGTELKGVIPALPFLEGVATRGDSCRVGKRVAVIGGGNAAIDSARTALPHGRRGDRHLPPRAQGHAGHPGGDRGRRGRGREVRVPRHAAPHRRRQAGQR